jgi:hypothetical protein
MFREMIVVCSENPTKKTCMGEMSCYLLLKLGVTLPYKRLEQNVKLKCMNYLAQ